MPKPSNSAQNGFDTKSVKNGGCVFETFLERPGAQKGGAGGRSFWEAIFNQIFKKWHPKRHPKIDAEKALDNYAKRLQNDAKIDAEIFDFESISEKDEHARNCLLFTI